VERSRPEVTERREGGMDVGCKFMRYRWGLENVLARGESVRDAVDVCDCTSMAVTCVGVEWMARSR